jgi:hypothetical protein
MANLRAGCRSSPDGGFAGLSCGRCAQEARPVQEEGCWELSAMLLSGSGERRGITAATAGSRYYHDGNNGSATNNAPYRSVAALYDDAIGCINRSAVSVCEKRLLT